VLFGDETPLQLCPTLCRDYHQRGQQQKVTTPGKNRRQTIFGAVDYGTGCLTYLIQERGRSREFCQFLEAVVENHQAELAAGRALILVLDNASIHDSAETQRYLMEHRERFTGLHRFFLPRYSPLLNAIERLWRELRKKVTHNYFFEVMRALLQAAEDFFKSLAQPKERLIQLLGG